MNFHEIRKILSDTSYIRTGGSTQERNCAQYISAYCSKLGLNAKTEPFEVELYKDKCTHLCVDGREIPCKSYLGSANGKVQAQLYYLEDSSKISLKKCKNKIVLLNKSVGRQTYKELCDHGAVGFITYNGDLQCPDQDVDSKEIRYDIAEDQRLPCVNINVRDALYLAEKGSRFAELMVDQEISKGFSQNVVVNFRGKTDEEIIVSAHYDSTSLSFGAYDNMTGCIALLYLAEVLRTKQLERGVRLVWCGSEERGLLGSLEYCNKHADELKRTRLNINLDMLGSKMGSFVAFSCANEQMLKLLEDFLLRNKYCGTARYAIRSSDSNSFLKYGVPAVSFARYAPAGVARIHTRYDTLDIVSAKMISTDMKMIEKFTDYVANLPKLNEIATISDKIASDIKEYFSRNT